MYLDEEVGAAIREQMAALRDRVTGVLGSVFAGADGLLLLNDADPGIEPHDIAAMAASTVGIGRQLSLSLGQGAFLDCTVRSGNGYFAVYGVGDRAVLAVLASEGLNLARLHLEARSVAARLAEVMSRSPIAQPGSLFATS